MSEKVEPLRRIHDESIRTGEAVELAISPASPLIRGVSLFVDVVVTLLVCAPIAIVLLTEMGQPSQSAKRILSIGGIVLIALIVPLISEALTQGRSLGKWVFGLRVVRDDGGTITFRHSLVRVLCGLVEIYSSFGTIALVSSFVSPRSKRIGDWLAGTMVIQEPSAVTYPPLIMPPDLVQWANTAQIIDPGQRSRTVALRLMRSLSSLNPRFRQAAAEEIAQRFAAYVDPQPPRGTNPERFIAAVLVIQRDRDYRHAEENQARANRALNNFNAPRYGIE